MTYVFRNHTIERFFCGEYKFSGYDDYSEVPLADDYVWCYQVPLKTNVSQQALAVNTYGDKLKFVAANIDNKPFIIFTLTKLYDASITQENMQLDEAIAAFNRLAKQLSMQYPNIKLLDFAEFVRRVENGEWEELRGTDVVDWKFYFISQIPINPRWSRAFDDWYKESLRSLSLSRKKCVVLDLDGTLWKGIVGEDGVEHICMEGDYPGSAYHMWQVGLRQLSESGVLLAICSKNNKNDIDQVWEAYPNMPLKMTDFSAVRINWNNKVDNIIEISKELNIGLDSMVFIDDNPAERELVRQNLPTVEVPEWPAQPYHLPQFYQNLVYKYFRVYKLTDEDRQKAAQYQLQAERKAEQMKYSNMEDFLRSLQIHIQISKANEFTITRVAQMTQKTNQFNLTTHRYSEADIREMIESGFDVWTLSVEDKFGDNGITGLMICKRSNNITTIDTLLLSCRILGKGIEYVFVKSVLVSLLHDDDIIEATYIPTEKNVQTSDFWDKCGLKDVGVDTDGKKQYRGTLKDIDINIPEYYKVDIVL